MKKFNLTKCNIIGIAVNIMFTLSSCEDFIQIDAPKNELVAEAVFESDLSAKSAMAAIFVEISSTSGTFNSITALGGFAADELIPYLGTAEYDQIFQNSIVSTNTLISGIWAASYSNIYKTNLILEGLKKSTTLTPSVRDQLEGEAKFIRAFLHFYLINLFGDIPVIVSTDYRSNNTISRSKREDVYSAIILDLNDAKELLSDSYPNMERVRPSKWAAKALLARVYLFKGDWTDAELEATEVIDNTNLFSLTSLNEVFLVNSREAIWQLLPVLSNRNTNDGSTFILTAPPTFASLNSNFPSVFEAGDLRKEAWVGIYTDQNNSTWFFPFKYKIKVGSNPMIEYSTVLRLAEQYLIRAEARAMRNNFSDAISDVDQIRERAGLSLLKEINPSIGLKDLLLVIENERRLELFSEWGHRWFDLSRTNRSDEVLAGTKSDWQETDKLFPIPESEILINPNLKPQNLGY